MPYTELKPLSRLQRTAAAFGPAVIVLTLGLIILFSAYNSRSIRRQSMEIGEILRAAGRLQTQLVDAQTAQRGYLVTGHPSYLPAYTASRDSASQTLAALRNVLHGTQGREHALRALDSLVPLKIADLDQGLALQLGRTLDTALLFSTMDRSQRLMTQVRAAISELRQSEQTITSARENSEDHWEYRTLVIAAIGTVIAVTCAVLANMFLTRFADAQTRAADASKRRSQLATELAIAQTTARESAEASNIAKTHFLTAMSHELRTPLNAINGYTELLSMGIAGDVTPHQQDFLDRIARSGRYLLALINDVLNFAKLEAGRVAFRVEDTPLDPILRSVEQMTALQFSKGGVQYTYIAKNPTLHVTADPERVRQIVLNLVINAVKNTSKGGSVTLRSRSVDSHAVIEVIDTGCGISSTKLSTIFDPFVQIDRHLTTEGSQQGVGLGLSISRDLARQMGGELSVESELGAGSTFTLTLPIPGASTSPHAGRDGFPAESS